jgi:hypothetical protein
MLCRKGFGHVVQVNKQLISVLDAKQGAAVDIDNAALRVTLDVIGRVGFGKDFGATRDLSDGRANLSFDMMAAGEDTLAPRSSFSSHNKRDYIQRFAGDIQNAILLLTLLKLSSSHRKLIPLLLSEILKQYCHS